MALAADDAVFLHCLPAHRGEEVAADVIDGPRSAVWQQAANRLPTEQAVLYALVDRDGRAERCASSSPSEATRCCGAASRPTPHAQRAQRRASPSRRSPSSPPTHELVVTHGNGPQVGLLALQGEAYAQVAPYPLDVLGAESEGMIGYLLDQELVNALGDASRSRRCSRR